MEGALGGLTSLQQKVCVKILVVHGHKCQSCKDTAATGFLKVFILT